MSFMDALAELNKGLTVKRVSSGKNRYMSLANWGGICTPVLFTDPKHLQELFIMEDFFSKDWEVTEYPQV